MYQSFEETSSQQGHPKFPTHVHLASTFLLWSPDWRLTDATTRWSWKSPLMLRKKKVPCLIKKCPLSDEISPFCYWFLLISTASSAYLYIYMHTILYIYVCSFWLIHFPYTNEPSERSDLLTIPQFRTIKRITTYIICLVVDLPLWKIWVRQLGWWNSQLNGKS